MTKLQLRIPGKICYCLEIQCKYQFDFGNQKRQYLFWSQYSLMIQLETGHFMTESILGDINHMSWLFLFFQWPFKFTTFGGIMDIAFQFFLDFLNFLQLGITYHRKPIMWLCFPLTCLQISILNIGGVVCFLRRMKVRMSKVNAVLRMFLSVCQDRSITLLW